MYTWHAVPFHCRHVRGRLRGGQVPGVEEQRRVSRQPGVDAQTLPPHVQRVR